MIITITGDAGSGKSTIGKKLAEKLGYERFYIGQIRRDAAKKKGMTLAEYNVYGETHPETDIEVDEYQKKLGEKRDDFIIEGRTSWFLIPQSLKIYFKVAPLEGASRIYQELQKENNRNEDTHIQTIADILESNQKRLASDKYRYQKYYQKDCFDEKNFDFVIDTTDLTREQVFEKTLEYVQNNLK
ncbi:MAG: hypothetical protein ACD_11C00135G0002 [uncultured bacterium]|nr:MAG: hypothetical protein ACD_11C00135G0002 [uncultured bacterium]